jgi:predicted lipid-binding transport protein (Tim44 family)
MALNDQLRIFNDTKNAPWEAIWRLNQAANGAGNFGTSQVQGQQGTNWGGLLGGLGMGLSGLF